MKKLFAFFVIAFMMSFAVQSYAASDVEIYKDGEKLECEATPVNMDGFVLVPMRAVFESFDVDVSWDGENRTVWTERNGEFICIPIDNDIMSTGVRNSDGVGVWVDQIHLDMPAKIINDYTYVPIRAVSETLGAAVAWDGENNRVIIDSRENVKGAVYYASDSDYQKLFAIDKNGSDRQKLSDKSVCELEMYEDYVYYLSKDERYLYRANDIVGEELVIDKAVNKIGISDGWIYYQESDGGKESGVIYRMNIESGKIQALSDRSVRYPRKNNGYIYFNVDGDNEMYGVTVDGEFLYKINLGDVDIKLYTFNCFFFGDYLLSENGAWYGNLMRINPDGTDVKTLTQSNSIICKKQTPSDKIIFVRPSDGQDIYCINLDGSNEHLVVKGDSSWISIDVLAQWENTIYYKNPMRDEVYRVNLDGSDNNYVCFADDVRVYDGRLFSTYQGLYTGSLDASDLVNIYDRDIKDFDVIGDDVYIIDKKSGKLYISDVYGNKNVVTNESVGEWVCE